MSVSAAGLVVARVVLLLLPVVLAFRTAGTPDDVRQWALIAAAVAVVLAAITAPTPVVRRRGLVAVVALAALVAWIWLSRSWAPDRDAAADDAERTLLYLLATVAGWLAWRERRAARWVEPAVVAGTTLVAGYALAGRLLPGAVPQVISESAYGRLEQPITYWNGLGLLCVMGLVLAVRLLGDGERRGATRALGGAAVPVLALATYLTFSRGALAALAGGLVVLVACSPSWRTVRAVLLAAGASLLAVLPSSLSETVRAGAVAGDQAAGTRTLVILLLAGALTAAASRWVLAGRPEPLPRLRSAGRLAGVAVVALLAVAIVAGSQRPTATAVNGASNSRLTEVGSNRYAYWRVALRTFADDPVVGTGTGGFRVAWLRERTIDERVVDAHSLELEALAELGLVGAALLLAWLGATAVAARDVLRRDGALAAGPVAALSAFALQSAIDWDWELPAVSLVALGLAAMLLARAEAPA